MSGIHLPPGETSIAKIIQAIRQIQQGRDDASGVVNLTVSSLTTTVSAPNVASTTNIILSPASAAAASEWGAGTIYVDPANVTQGQFVISHTNSTVTATTRTVYWAARG